MRTRTRRSCSVQSRATAPAATAAAFRSTGETPFTQCTIANNYAYAAGGGIYLRHASHLLTSTIIATNGVGLNAGSADIGGLDAQLDGGYNLILVSALAPPDDTLTYDPMLGPLQDNGGPTLTHALLSGSPALDAGSNDYINFAYDQRGHGFRRVVGSSADIGAFEHQDIVFQSGFDAGP